MPSANLNDLKYLYHGGGSDAEYAFLQSAAAAGRTAADSLQGGAVEGRWTVGSYYSPIGVVGTLVAAVDTLVAMPLWVPPGRGINQLAFNTIAATATSTTRVGVYADTGGGAPGALLFDSGSIATAAAGTFTATVTGLTNLRGGVYWLAAVSQTVGTNYTKLDGELVVGMTSLNVAATSCSYYRSIAALAALPATWGAPTDGGGWIRVLARAA